VRSKILKEFSDRVFQVEVRGAPGPLWRQIRTPGNTTLRNLGVIIRAAFGWPKNSRGGFLYPVDRDPLLPEEEDGTVDSVFQSVDMFLLFHVYQRGNPGWEHLVCCIGFRERSDCCAIEMAVGAPLPPAARPFARFGNSEAAEMKIGIRPFDSVGTKTRLLNRRRIATKKRSQPNRCRAIVLLDSEPIRKKWENELSTLRVHIEKLESVIRKFENQDRLAFQVWLRNRFGQLLSKIQQTVERIAAARQRLDLISLLDRKYQGRKSRAELLKLALAVESGNAPWPEDQENDGENPVGLEDLKRMARNLNGADRAFLETELDDLETVFGELPPEVREFRDALLGDGTGPNDLRERCKTIYRKIVLLLHPDRAGDLDQERVQLWHRAQTAYHVSDLVTLEAILDGCTERVVEKSVSQLKAAVLESERQLERLRRRIEQLKKDPAWSFTSRTGKKLESRERRVQRDLSKELESLAFELAFLEECFISRATG
jgi:hypothetical protein